jgi:hypothetical protein
VAQVKREGLFHRLPILGSGGDRSCPKFRGRPSSTLRMVG